MTVSEVTVSNVLTRTSGYLDTIASHSLQPYRGCSFGKSLCGVGCYVQHNPFLLKGRSWGDFLEVRVNAAKSYLRTVERERRYAHKAGLDFGIFMSSSTDPFLPQERRYGVTRQLLEAMLDEPPEVLIVQTHTAAVAEALDLLSALSQRCRLRVHLSIESDLDRLPGLPPAASPVRARMEAAGRMKQAGIRTVITVAPLLPIEDPRAFFSALSEVSDAVVLDHFVDGDGSKAGQRTLKTALPEAMERRLVGSSRRCYLDEILEVACRCYGGEIGVGRDGFAGRYLKAGMTSSANRDTESPTPMSGK